MESRDINTLFLFLHLQYHFDYNMYVGSTGAMPLCEEMPSNLQD